MERLVIAFFLLCAAFASSASGGTWVQRTQQMPRPTGFPAAYTWDPYSMPMVYDERRQVTVGFGGYTNPPLIYLPVSEFNRWEWSDANPPDTWVDFGNQGSQNGSPANPWSTLTTALYQAPVDGVIFLMPGSLAETLDSTTLRVMPVTLRAPNGPVLIGRAP